MPHRPDRPETGPARIRQLGQVEAIRLRGGPDGRSSWSTACDVPRQRPRAGPWLAERSPGVAPGLGVERTEPAVGEGDLRPLAEQLDLRVVQSVEVVAVRDRLIALETSLELGVARRWIHLSGLTRLGSARLGSLVCGSLDCGPVRARVSVPPTRRGKEQSADEGLRRTSRRPRSPRSKTLLPRHRRP